MSRILRDLSELPIGFGGAAISGEGAGYGFGDISKDESVELLRYSYDLGIRVFDTAPIYGFGESEKRIAKAFKTTRDKVFIISKSGVSWHSNMRVNMTNDPKETQKMLHESLERLETDYIDLFMIHWPDKSVDIRRVMEVLSKAKHQGKIKSIGLCNTFTEDFVKASEVDEVEVIQAQLNVFENKEALELLDLCEKNDLSFMSWGTLDKGILTGRVHEKRTFDKTDCRSWAPWWKAMDKKEKFQKMKLLLPYLEEIEKTPLSLAISFNRQFSHVDNLLCGSRSKKQWQELVHAYSNPLTQAELEQVNRILHES
ncbi:aldo/keto reductase [Halobacteriovorax sp. HLS]|uniref:aldo/keto reductase n=1 Tax=Halobacteriovorax sp. HLS TaxID=2234000 RepID=UPI000FD6D62C|nr:aldo/keto reductase [Halobacteriovorax sp. HLS]